MTITEYAAMLSSNKQPFCMATIIDVIGSAPRHIGSKMIIVDKDHIHGSIGGGNLEYHVIDDALQCMQTRNAQKKTYELSAKGLQPCGGQVEIFIEPILPKKDVIIFGAGHIAQKLTPLLAELDFNITIVDERSEQISHPAFSEHNKINTLPLDFLTPDYFHDYLHLICLTHKHIHDKDIVGYSFNKPFAYFGLISSRHKWELFSDKFRAFGISNSEINRITTPIGLDIGAETPMELAIAIAAQLIQFCQKPTDFQKKNAHKG